MTNRHRIIEQRGRDADAWLRRIDRFDGDIAAFVRDVAIDNAHFYRPAPLPADLPFWTISQAGPRPFGMTQETICDDLNGQAKSVQIRSA